MALNLWQRLNITSQLWRKTKCFDSLLSSSCSMAAVQCQLFSASCLGLVVQCQLLRASCSVPAGATEDSDGHQAPLCSGSAACSPGNETSALAWRRDSPQDEVISRWDHIKMRSSQDESSQDEIISRRDHLKMRSSQDDIISRSEIIPRWDLLKMRSSQDEVASWWGHLKMRSCQDEIISRWHYLNTKWSPVMRI